MFFLLALVTAAIGVIPLLLASRPKAAAFMFGASTLALTGWYYLSLPALANPFWGSVGIIVILCWALCAFIIQLTQNRKNRYDDKTISSFWAFAIVGVVCFLGRECGGCGAFRDKEYRDMLGKVEERTWTDDVQPKDPDHVRLVPKDLAEWLANKQLGAAPGTVGSQFDVDKSRMTLQFVKGELWYVAPLDFKGYGVWDNVHVAPGYVMVSGEDPERTAVVKTDQRFAYTPGAYFGKNLERHLWTNGYSDKGIGEISFELDDESRPWWVVTIYHPTIAWSGDKIDGVAIVDPTDGKISFHKVGDVPHWVDRVFPASTVKQYMSWRGEFIHGWKNTLPYFGSRDGMTEPQEPSFIHGSDGEPYWVTDISAANASDHSLLGLMYVDARTGHSVYYRASGSIDEGILQAVNNLVSYKKLHGSDPVLYNMYGTMASIVPLLGESHTFQGVAIVRVDTQEVAEGATFTLALRAYQQLLAKASASAPQTAHESVKVSGKVERFAVEVQERESTYTFTVVGVQRIFAGSSAISVELPLTRVGDDIALTVIPSDEPVIPILSFDNASIAAPGPIPGAAPTVAPEAVPVAK